MQDYQNKKSILFSFSQRLMKLKKRLGLHKVPNGRVNIHLGVHKTATTFVQENLSLIDDPSFHYTPLKQFRAIRRNSSYLHYLGMVDWKKRVLISDENIIGDNGTVLLGRLYPEFKKKAEKYLEPFKNRALIRVYITIRPMATFLPSQYCEYLRRNKYISYDKFLANVDIQQMSWYDVLSDFIKNNQDLNIIIFDFTLFQEFKSEWLKELSFGLEEQFHDRIPPSRSSFTYKELSALSGGELVSDSEEKFDPHSAEEKEMSMKTYAMDLDRLSKMPNVTMKP